MSAALVFIPENRLRSVIGGAGDPTSAQLVAAAESRVEALAPQIRAFVDEQRRVIAEFGDAAEEVIFGECEAIGAAALAIAEVAAAAGLPATGEAARGIYAMIDALRRKGVWHTEALQAHLGALLLFNAEPNLPPAAAREVLDRLQRTRDVVGVPK